MENEKLSGIMLTAAAMAGYSVISEPGKYELVVATTTSEKNLVTREGGLETYITNFKAIAEDKLGQLQALFNGRNEVPIEEAQGLFLTGNIINRPGVALPMKGEKVECVLDWVKAKDFAETDQTVLRITGIRVNAAKKAEKLDVTKFFTPVASEPAIAHKPAEPVTV